jgi:uncharacterized membrane protein
MEPGTARLTRSIVVGASRRGVFHLCEQPEELSQLLTQVLSVERTSRRTHRWCAVHEGSFAIWETETTSVDAPRRIEWRSVGPGGGARLDGEVSFRELPDRRTEVRVVLRCHPLANRSLRETEQLLDRSLECLKAGAEAPPWSAPPGEERRLDQDRAASMADEGGAAAAWVAGGTPVPGKDAGPR